MIKRLIFKLIMMLVVITGWLVYYNPAMIGQLGLGQVNPESLSTEKIKQAVSKLGEEIKSDIPSPQKSTKVYQWRDASGSLHVSDSPPAGVEHVQVKEYKSDVNVMPATRPGSVTGQQSVSVPGTTATGQTGNSGTSQPASGGSEGGRVGTYKDLLKQAQQARDQMNQRNRDLDSSLNQ